MSRYDTIANVAADIAARLAADAYFIDITVITDRKGDINTEVQKAIGPVASKGGKSGVCVIVTQPVGTVSEPSIPASMLDLDISVRVLENVVINTGSGGTGKSAASIARAIVAILHLYNSPGICGLIHPSKPTIIPVASPVLTYDVQFIAQEKPMDSSWQNFKCMPVSDSLSSENLPTTVTLTCPTPGATIRYTLDGSYPASANAAAHVYAAPFQITTAAALRLVATKSGLIDSDTNLINLT